MINLLVCIARCIRPMPSCLMVRAGLLPATPENGESESVFTVGLPAPDIGNEYADTYNFGVIWTPSGVLDGPSVQADFWRFNVTDRVLPEPGILAVQPEIDLFNQFVNDPANYIRNDSIGTDGMISVYDEATGELVLDDDGDPVAQVMGGARNTVQPQCTGIAVWSRFLGPPELRGKPDTLCGSGWWYQPRICL